jgi:hypothetical protein
MISTWIEQLAGIIYVTIEHPRLYAACMNKQSVLTLVPASRTTAIGPYVCQLGLLIGYVCHSVLKCGKSVNQICLILTVTNQNV